MVILVVECSMHRMLIVILHRMYVLHRSFLNLFYHLNQLLITFLHTYVKVSIDGVDNNLDALNDSGSQINLIHRSIIPDDKMQTFDRIRGAFGAPVQSNETCCLR